MRTLAVLFSAGLLAGCSTAPRGARDVLAEASEAEFGAVGGLCPDTVAIASNSAVDYEDVVNGCLARHEESMHALFWLSEHAGFDAASAQGHAAVCGVLLRKLGDGFFGERLAQEPRSVQDAVRDDLLYDLGYGNTDVTLTEIRRRYPKTFPGGSADNPRIEADAATPSEGDASGDE
jgi:hypothetical protein